VQRVSLWPESNHKKSQGEIMNSINVFSVVGFLFTAGFWLAVSLSVGLLGFFGGLDCGHVWYGPGWEYKKRLLWYIPLVLVVFLGWYILATISPFEIILNKQVNQ
jgi:hypothetical protein